MKLTSDMVLTVMNKNSGATYYIANLVKNMFPDWNRKTPRVLYLLKKLEKDGVVERYESSYVRQISWRISKK